MSGSWASWAIPAAVGIGSALIGSRASRDAANTAANAATASSDRAADVQMQMFQQGRDDLAPFREAGLRGLAQFENSLGTSFQQSPGYQFAFDEGVNAIDRAASARGMLGSGARLRELTRFGQGMANQEFGNYQNRLASLAGLGQTATGQGVGIGAQAGAGVGNTLFQGGMAAGQARAGGQVGVANTTLGGINQGLGLYALMNPQYGNVAQRPATPNTTGAATGQGLYYP